MKFTQTIHARVLSNGGSEKQRDCAAREKEGAHEAGSEKDAATAVPRLKPGTAQ